MAAAAFAEAGDQETARKILGVVKRPVPVARKRIRRRDRLELRARDSWT
jgi:hypothetical protein